MFFKLETIVAWGVCFGAALLISLLPHEFYFIVGAIYYALLIAWLIYFKKEKINFSPWQRNAGAAWILLCLIVILSKEIKLLWPMIAMGLVGPLGEELFFRQWLFKKFKHPVWVTSFLFGLYHLSNYFLFAPAVLFKQVLVTGLIGGPFFAFLASKSLLYAWLAHSSYNVFLIVSPSLLKI